MAPIKVSTVWRYTKEYSVGKIKATTLSIMPRTLNIFPNSSAAIIFDIMALIAIALVLTNKSIVVPV